MEGNCRTLLRKFCLESTYLGLKYLVLYPDIVSRTFWIVNIIVANVMAVILSLRLYDHFLDLPTRITIENQYQPIKNLSFPAITLCSPAQITMNGADFLWDQLDLGNQSSMDATTLLPKLLSYYQLQPVFVENALMTLQQNLDKRHLSVPEVLGILPQSCGDFLKICIFRGRLKDCSDLFQPILTHIGYCCIFNNIYYYGDDKKNEDNPYFKKLSVSAAGMEQGLTVAVDYEPDNAVNATVINAGVIKVLLNNWSEFPSTHESALVHGNSESFHVLSTTHTYCSEDVIQLPSWNRKCFFENERRLPYFDKYHKADCDLACITKSIEERCDCVMFYVPGVRFDRTCNITKLQCIIIAKANLNKYFEEGHCECSRDCESFAYKDDVTFGNLAALPYLMMNPFTNLDIKNSTAIMHFFFPSPVYVKQKQETVMSLITVVSNLGGVFGLCVGCSVMTLLEIAFYVYSAIKNHAIRRKHIRVHVTDKN